MNKKGFTLIELLAVILILGIIALIAVPSINNIIEESKRNSFLRSAEGYISAVETNSVKSMLTNDGFMSPGIYTVDELKDKVSYKGQGPAEGWVRLIDNKVMGCSLKQGKIVVKCSNDNKILLSGETNIEEKPLQIYSEVFHAGDVVYFDPVSSDLCNSTTFKINNIKNNTSTCYRWRILETNDKNIYGDIIIQLDHNIVETVEWISKADYNDNAAFGTKGNTNKGPITALKKLNQAINNWERVPLLNYSQSFKTGSSSVPGYEIKCINGECKINGNIVIESVRARMITGLEVANITKTNSNVNPSFNWSLQTSYNDYYYFSNEKYTIGTKSLGTGNKELSWLIENTNALMAESGATTNQYTTQRDFGYWAMDPSYDYAYSAWDLGSEGDWGNYGNDVSNYHDFGLRPVFTIPKLRLSK